MMVIDTVHSSGVGRIHGQTKLMKLVRPLNSLQGSVVKGSIVSTSTVEKKGGATINLDGNLDSRPTLVIRRRIMVPQSDEAADGSQFMLCQPPIVLSNQPKPSTTTVGLNPSTENKTDLTVRRFDVLGRSSASTQDPVCKSTTTPMKKPRPKTMHLFDLNKLPTSPDCFSPTASPTSTIASADSTTLITTDAASTPAMATDHVSVFTTSPNISKTFTDAEGANLLAVDLGLLPPASPDITRRHNVEDSSSALQQEPQYCTDIPTPARKRLRKLSEYAGGHMSSTGHAAPMASKSWTTDGDDVGNHRDVTKTLALPGGEAKVHGKDAVVDDEVLGAVSVLLRMASSTKRRREFSYISSMATERSTSVDLEPGPSSPVGSDLADSETTSSRSWGSGGSVLLRPSNKQRYRLMAELMAQTPILKRV